VGSLKGAEGFRSYYAELFGARWPRLEQALTRAPSRVLRANAFAGRAARERDTHGLEPCAELEGCFHLGGAEFGPLGADDAGLLSGYIMDAASVAAARALEVRPGETVLDLCAAPGGKALVLLEALGEQGSLTLNDRSPRRSARLRSVLRQYVPEHLASRVRLTTRDARRWGLKEPAAYDAILLDAPCSSERHVLADPAELARWSASRVRRLAVDQHALLASAALALRPGGRLLYCTCALTPDENDRVVARLLERGRHTLRPERVECALGEATEFGWRIQPDLHGYGPIYFAKLTKPRAQPPP
jgi:16S rRNA C967 or C1407 C5-methylase (RsmB/RsmF family)